MSRSFNILPLGAPQIPIVFPLVNAAYPDIDMDRWQQFAGALIEAPQLSGALGLQGEGGYFSGVLIYRISRDLRTGLYLAVDLFVALDLVDGRAAVEALMSTAEARAAELDCASVQLRIDSSHKSLVQHAKRTGYATAAELLSKKIPKRTAPN